MYFDTGYYNDDAMMGASNSIFSGGIIKMFLIGFVNALAFRLLYSLFSGSGADLSVLFQFDGLIGMLATSAAGYIAYILAKMVQ